MPVTCALTALSRSDISTVGDLLRAVAAGGIEPIDVVVIPVGAAVHHDTAADQVGTDASDGGGPSADVPTDQDLDAVIGMRLSEIVAAYELTGKPGQIAQTVAKVGERPVRLILLGVGDRSARSLRRAGGELGRAMRTSESAVASLPDVCTGPGDRSPSAHDDPVSPTDRLVPSIERASERASERARAFAEGIVLGSYRYSEKSRSPDERLGDELVVDAGGTVRLLVPADDNGSAQAARAIDNAAATGAAVALARDLSNTPSVRKHPQWLADEAAKVAAESGLGFRAWTEDELASAGFGGILAVGSGSERGPRLIELRYEPPAAKRHVVLVGKGITFDSGGLSLKPNDGMKAMKTDMAGGAAVIAAMSALARLGAADRVTGLVAAAENMPSGTAYRPGDIITQFGGTSVEVLNTDAEGRLVLADGLAYAVAQLAPDVIVDVATLTGAARIALGSSYAALYTSSDDLAAALLAAGEASGDRLWRMPLADDYVSALDSPVADLANVSRIDGQPGSITAALFLRHFAGSGDWAHLDIAGAARSSTDEGDTSTGATGFGVRLFLKWLSS